MNSLTTPPLAPVLTRLFAESEQSEIAWRRQTAQIPAEERAARMRNMTDYMAFYGTAAKEAYLAVSRETANLLYMLARSCNAKSIVEFGTSYGISTLHLAAAVKDNGGGKVIGSEFEPSKVERARANMVAGGVAGIVDIRVGDALQTLARDLPDSIDLVLLDGAKSLYPPVLSLLEPRLRSGALIVADNADMAPPEYLERVRAVGGHYVSVPFADDVELSMRL